MSIKISELPQATSVSSNDIVPIVQSGTTKRATKEMMFPTIASTIESTSTNSEVAGAKAVYDATLDNYSTTEQVVGTWINGKPLYRKAVTLTTLPNNNTKNFAHGISNLEQVVQSTGTIWWAGSQKEGNLLPYISSSSNFVSLYWNATNVTVRASGDYSGRNGVAILYYTKTTDTATRSLNLMKSANEEETEEKELEEKEPIEEVKQEETKEPILEKIEEEKTEAEGSGDTI